MTELAPQDRELLDKVRKRVEHFERTLGCHYSDGLWARMDKLYHSYTGLKDALRGTSGNGRDDVYQDARKEFGHELFIPFAFSIVETVLPAMLSNRPRILVLPRNEASERNVENMKATIDSQQGNLPLEVPLQTAAKTGLIYGLGPMKSYWLRREGQQQKLTPLSSFHPARLKGEKWAVSTCAEPLWDDPTAESIPVRDFFWDPFAASIDLARWGAHRTWRDTAYVRDRLADPTGWTRMELEPSDYESGNSSAEKYRKSVQPAFDAQSLPVPSRDQARETSVHEVIEYHDRGQIVTILDRRWVVSVIPNQTWYGRLPFHCYRPTEVPNQMVGKGEIEPVEDLQFEMNQLRTDRRWAAMMALQPVLFYNDGVVDPDQIKIGPGEMNPVNGDPRELIWQLNISDVPASSYRETAEIASDIVRASGISDAFAGGDNSAETATGAQLQLAQASRRIQLKTHRAEIELIQPIGRHWLALNQRHILESRDIRTPQPPAPDEPERRWAWYKVGPNELAGEFDIEIDGGSTAPDNVPQKRQDAQFKLALLGSPAGQALLNASEVMVSLLEDAGFKNPEAYLQSGQPVPPETLRLIALNLAELGMDPGEAQEIVEGSFQQAVDARQQAVMGAAHGAPPPGAEAAGGSPQPQLPPGQPAPGQG